MTAAEIAQGNEFLRQADPVLADICQQVGACTLVPSGDPFTSLARSIVGQQISVQAAATIWGRVCALCESPAGLTPQAILALPEESLVGAGLSKGKRLYIRDLAHHFAESRVRAEELPALSDEEIIARLLPIKGIGRWTAEMFLIFSLGRPDVFPVDDLGLRNAVQRAYALPARPTTAELLPYGERWRPYRSLATWYLWQSLK